jgi:hypothetical protein
MELVVLTPFPVGVVEIDVGELVAVRRQIDDACASGRL